jgi:YesN/AraC family two-component response regulator
MGVQVLIVDDSDATRALLKRRLETLGCEVIGEAINAAQGLSMFRALHPAVVTLDLMMPVVEGLDAKTLLGHILEEAPEVAVFVVSSFSKVTQAPKFLEAGAAGYIQKPFINFDDLSRKLKEKFPELVAARDGANPDEK